MIGLKALEEPTSVSVLELESIWVIVSPYSKSVTSKSSVVSFGTCAAVSIIIWTD